MTENIVSAKNNHVQTKLYRESSSRTVFIDRKNRSNHVLAIINKRTDYAGPKLCIDIHIL